MTAFTLAARQKVEEFHRVFGHPCPPEGDLTGLIQNKDLRALRIKLIKEEIMDELIPALANEDVLETADAIGDSLYVLYGASIAFGLANVIVFQNNRPLHIGAPGLDTEKFNDSTANQFYLVAEPEISRFIEAVNACEFNPNLAYDVQDCLDNLITQLYYLGYNQLGLPVNEIFDEIHASNMSKLGEDGKPIYREDGKVMKGPNFRLPDIYKVIFLASARGESAQ